MKPKFPKWQYLFLGIVVSITVALIVIPKRETDKQPGASTYAIQNVDSSNYVITVTTSTAVSITTLARDYTLVHLGIQNDGSTPSVSTDYIVMQPMTLSNGTAVSSAGNYSDGSKMIVLAGAAATYSGNDIIAGPDGPCEVQIIAVGHGCKAELIRGHVLP